MADETNAVWNTGRWVRISQAPAEDAKYGESGAATGNGGSAVTGSTPLSREAVTFVGAGATRAPISALIPEML